MVVALFSSRLQVSSSSLETPLGAGVSSEVMLEHEDEARVALRMERTGS